MAICYYKEVEDGKLALWKTTEELDNLLDLVQPEGKELYAFERITNPRRKKEWLSARALLRELIGQKSIIDYSPDGRPFIKGSDLNISISHTGNYVAILIHPTRLPGIDIEQLGRPVGKVAKRFLAVEEYEFCQAHSSPSQAMLIHWCGKEAVFKIVPYSNIDFAKQIKLVMNPGVVSEGGAINAFFYKEEQYLIPVQLNCFFFESLIIVWGWN